MMVAVLVTATLGGVLLGSAVVGRHRAQSAADLAALAAAARVPAGRAAACGEAQAVAAVMHASVRRCDIDQLDVVVTVAVFVGGQIGGQALATARAGPGGSFRPLAAGPLPDAREFTVGWLPHGH
jgi:secretion/DNA translocation related TadE-like protein